MPGRTVVRLGWRGADGLERAEVHWPGKGKGKARVWRCAVLEPQQPESPRQQPESSWQPESPQPPRRGPPESQQQPPRGPGVGKGDRVLGIVTEKARAQRRLEQSQARKRQRSLAPAPEPAPKRARAHEKRKSREGEQIMKFYMRMPSLHVVSCIALYWPGCLCLYSLFSINVGVG